jgi:hypothetical protein
MKVLICGSRDITDKDKVFKIIADIIKENGLIITEIISGGANGIDFLGAEFANDNNIDLTEINAEWNNLEAVPCFIKTNKFGKKYNSLAGMNRNLKMLDLKPDLVIAIHNNSSGTKHTIENARKRGIKVIEYLWEF